MVILSSFNYPFVQISLFDKNVITTALINYCPFKKYMDSLPHWVPGERYMPHDLATKTAFFVLMKSLIVSTTSSVRNLQTHGTSMVFTSAQQPLDGGSCGPIFPAYLRHSDTRFETLTPQLLAETIWFLDTINPAITRIARGKI